MRRGQLQQLIQNLKIKRRHICQYIDIQLPEQESTDNFQNVYIKHTLNNQLHSAINLTRPKMSKFTNRSYCVHVILIQHWQFPDENLRCLVMYVRWHLHHLPETLNHQAPGIGLPHAGTRPHQLSHFCNHQFLIFTLQNKWTLQYLPGRKVGGLERLK